MDDLAYRNAVKRKKELQAEMEEIDSFLRLWRKYAGTEGGQLVVMPPTVSAAVEGKAPSVRIGTRLSKGKLAPILRDVLVQAGRPMTRGELVKALDKRDIAIGGGDPRKNMGTIIWRLKDRFVNIEGRATGRRICRARRSAMCQTKTATVRLEAICFQVNERAPA